MFCSKCGKSITDNMKFCNNCGEKIEVPKEAKNLISTSPNNVETKKSPIKKKVIYIAMAAIVIVGLVITNFIINPPTSGSEVPYDLEWGSTNEQVRRVDKLATGLRVDQFISEEGFATSFMSCKDFGIKGNTSVNVYYYFGHNDSLGKIEITVGTNIDGKVQDYSIIKSKIEKYYNKVCKVSPTKSNAEYGDDEILTWYTDNNVIRIGDDLGYKDAVVITITP